MKICLLGVELFHEDRPKADMVKLIVTFRNFAKARKEYAQNNYNLNVKLHVKLWVAHISRYCHTLPLKSAKIELHNKSCFF